MCAHYFYSFELLFVVITECKFLLTSIKLLTYSKFFQRSYRGDFDPENTQDLTVDTTH
jgi:hypothetical protein